MLLCTCASTGVNTRLVTAGGGGGEKRSSSQMKTTCFRRLNGNGRRSKVISCFQGKNINTQGVIKNVSPRSACDFPRPSPRSVGPYPQPRTGETHARGFVFVVVYGGPYTRERGKTNRAAAFVRAKTTAIETIVPLRGGGLSAVRLSKPCSTRVKSFDGQSTRSERARSVACR